MSPTDQTDIDPLADLDDDLGDDWESAFQSEDFMFSEDDEANDFFLFDETISIIKSQRSLNYIQLSSHCPKSKI